MHVWVTDAAVILPFIISFIWGLMRFYGLFTDLRKSLNRLTETVDKLDRFYTSHEVRISRLEEKTKTLFKEVERKDD